MQTFHPFTPIIGLAWQTVSKHPYLSAWHVGTPVQTPSTATACPAISELYF